MTDTSGETLEDEVAASDDGSFEPGPPSLRAILPSIVGGAAVPLAVYYAIRHRVGGDATALAIAGIPAAAWVGLQWLRQRRIDAIAAIALAGFVVGVAVSYALGGNAFVLKVRDSGFAFVFGLSSLLSIRYFPRPLMFYVGRAMSAGNDQQKATAFDELWEVAPARAVFRTISALWGIGLIVDAGVRVTLAAVLGTGTFLAVAPVVAAVFIGGMFAATVWFTRWTRSRPPVEQSPPAGGGSALWWIRQWTTKTNLSEQAAA